ncbi:MAG: hypothetical protein LBO66_15195 [Deltaproteobacteria bacterium]|jgi:hypothetical protein|nr:hypothetical protein [Deltaproteobacteria bacterium]
MLSKKSLFIGGGALAFLVVLHVLLTLLLGSRTWDNFETALNSRFGEGAWSSNSHSFSLLSRTLTVTGLRVTPPAPPAPTPAPPTGGAPEGEDPPPESPFNLEIDYLAVQGSLGGVWPRFLQPGQNADPARGALWKKLALKNLSFFRFVGQERLTVTAASLELGALALQAHDAEGLYALLASMSLASAALDSLQISALRPGPQAETVSFHVSRLALSEASFDPAAAPNPKSFLDLLLSLRASSLAADDAELKFSEGPQEIVQARVGSLAARGLAPQGLVDAWESSDALLKIASLAEPDRAESLAAQEIALKGLDLSVLLRRAKATVDRLSTSYYFPSLERVLSDLPRAADLVSPAVSLAQGTLKGVSLVTLGGLKWDIGAIAIEGPFVAGALPQGTVAMTEVVLSPPENTERLGDFALAFANFLRSRERPNLPLSLKATFASAPEAGILKWSLDSLESPGLAALSLGLEMGALSPTVLEEFSALSLDRFVASFPASEAQKGLSLRNFYLKYADHSLFEAIIDYNAAQYALEKASLRGEVFRLATVLTEELFGDSFLSGPKINNQLLHFINSPGELLLNVAPDPPLAVSAIESSPRENRNDLYNSLKVSLKYNQEPETPFLWETQALPPGAAD